MSEKTKSNDENSNDDVTHKMDLDKSKSDNETDDECKEVSAAENSTPTVSKQKSKSKSNLTPADKSLKIQTKIESAKKKEEKVTNKWNSDFMFIFFLE
jgi:hypothetical protein